MNIKRNTIQDNVYNTCVEQVEDESKSDLLSTHHIQKFMENKGFEISRPQVQSAFYALTDKGRLYKEHYNIWRLNRNG